MKVFVNAIIIGLLAGYPLAGRSADKADSPKTRAFLFTYAATIKDLPPGKEAHVWIPVPTSGPFQQVSIQSKDLPADAKMGTEKTYGNKMLFFTAKAGEDGTIPLKLTYKIIRKEIRTGESGKLTLKPSAQERVSRFLEPDALVPVGKGKPVDLMKERKLPRDQFAAAKSLYELVNDHMKYSKEGEGWGRGDAEWACDSKFGNCTDFHSLFISMARTKKIPAKFEMGFPIPEKRGSGVVGGYHCWAWFLPEGKGWVPVDISEANRHPSLREYYFGNLTEDRVQFTTGRDIDLVPQQKGQPLNFFIYPYVEVDGRSHPLDKIARSYSYQDLPSGK
jgi:transglutaminase-like putative cysteine protease